MRKFGNFILLKRLKPPKFFTTLQVKAKDNNIKTGNGNGNFNFVDKPFLCYRKLFDIVTDSLMRKLPFGHDSSFNTN